MYKEMVFEDLLSEIASSNMSADGGTVAALVGTLAASLGSKIANYTVTEGINEDYEVTLESVLEIFRDKEKLLDYSDKSSHYIGKFHSEEGVENEKKILKRQR